MTTLSDFYVERGAIGFSEQIGDGTPHLSYYLDGRNLSFVWDGESDHIDVCIGGYAEPVYYEIPVEPVPLVSVSGFKVICDRWAAENPEISEANLQKEGAS